MASQNENITSSRKKLITVTHRPEKSSAYKSMSSNQNPRRNDDDGKCTNINSKAEMYKPKVRTSEVKLRPTAAQNQSSQKTNKKMQHKTSIAKHHKYNESRDEFVERSNETKQYSPKSSQGLTKMSTGPNFSSSSLGLHSDSSRIMNQKFANSNRKHQGLEGQVRHVSHGRGQLVSNLEGQKQVCDAGKIINPKNYTVERIIPAQNAELIDVARAMNRKQFASKVKKLFDPEREAALQAIETGVYIGWRCFGNDFDCIRVSSNSKCFCGHLLQDHTEYQQKVARDLNCKVSGCICKKYAFIPSRPEEIGEWWLQKRPGFDVNNWRAKCRCKHTHVQHNPNKHRECKVKSCSCFGFDSNFLCAACDRHWEEHDTYFDDIHSREQKGLPYGEEYLPFHELPQLRNLVLTGNENDDSQYNTLTSGPYAIPRSRPTKLAMSLRGELE